MYEFVSLAYRQIDKRTCSFQLLYSMCEKFSIVISSASFRLLRIFTDTECHINRTALQILKNQL